MLITIAIPTFNNVATISKAINSCITQLEANQVELLVVNNNSSDGTAEILKKYETSGQIRVIKNEFTVNLFENHNVCFRNALGRYVLFCHSDDALDPRAIEIIKRQLAFRNYPDKYVLWGHSLFRDFSQSIINANFRVGELFSGVVAVKPFLFGGLTPSGTCYSRNFIDYGGFLPAKLKITPSDASSMILLAIKSFRFEMMEEIVFSRTSASTLKGVFSEKNILDSYVDAFDALTLKVGGEIFSELIAQADSMKAFPVFFYCYLLSMQPKLGLRSVFKRVIRRPLILRSKQLRASIFGAIFNQKTASSK